MHTVNVTGKDTFHSVLMALYVMLRSHASQRQEQHEISINWELPLVVPSRDGKSPDSSQVEFKPQIAGTSLACLLERKLAEAEWDGKRICTKTDTPDDGTIDGIDLLRTALLSMIKVTERGPSTTKTKLLACVRSDRVAAANSRIAGPCTGAWIDGPTRCDHFPRRSGRHSLLCLLYGCETSESCSPLAHNRSQHRIDSDCPERRSQGVRSNTPMPQLFVNVDAKKRGDPVLLGTKRSTRVTDGDKPELISEIESVGEKWERQDGRSSVTCAYGRCSPTVTGDRIAQKWDGEKR
ncbi:hypothetical protein FJTKL_10349 [Diaporthe vaccinii]|uniref:Uncharacterized protein n=1 Tax=Diaporthe vaccinii TaxID=105482 RepID=A0ABR4EK50_9PEZI